MYIYYKVLGIRLYYFIICVNVCALHVSILHIHTRHTPRYIYGPFSLGHKSYPSYTTHAKHTREKVKGNTQKSGGIASRLLMCKPFL